MKKILFLLFISALVASCGDDNEGSFVPQNKENVNANLVGRDASVQNLEIPHLNSRYDYICHKLSDGSVNYTIEYDKKLFHARWVAYSYDSKSSQRKVSRVDNWACEPYYKNEPYYQVSPGTFPDYARGHLCGAAERFRDREACNQTFYMSNMSPMLSKFNSWYWGATQAYDGEDGIESLIRDKWGRKVNDPKSSFYGGTLYLVKGGSLDQLRGYCSVRNMQGDIVQMAVPKYYWIACLFVSSSGSARSIGFYMEHKDYKNTSTEFLRELRRSSACSIDELELKTGIDFFCNLNDAIENYVEKNYSIADWDGL